MVHGFSWEWPQAIFSVTLPTVQKACPKSWVSELEKQNSYISKKCILANIGTHSLKHANFSDTKGKRKCAASFEHRKGYSRGREGPEKSAYFRRPCAAAVFSRRADNPNQPAIHFLKPFTSTAANFLGARLRPFPPILALTSSAAGGNQFFFVPSPFFAALPSSLHIPLAFSHQFASALLLSIPPNSHQPLPFHINSPYFVWWHRRWRSICKWAWWLSHISVGNWE